MAIVREAARREDDLVKGAIPSLFQGFNLIRREKEICLLPKTG
jgi:hypothetical protein